MFCETVHTLYCNYMLAYFQEFFEGGGGKIYCYTNLFCYANSSIVFRSNFRGANVFEGGQLHVSKKFKPSVNRGENRQTAICAMLVSSALQLNNRIWSRSRFLRGLWPRRGSLCPVVVLYLNAIQLRAFVSSSSSLLKLTVLRRTAFLKLIFSLIFFYLVRLTE